MVNNRTYFTSYRLSSNYPLESILDASAFRRKKNEPTASLIIIITELYNDVSVLFTQFYCNIDIAAIFLTKINR